ncbi:Fmu (Sun) domain protein [Methylocella silvestris BL2]|uniref:Fmu (Sun) domain protein n=1 Tax=Methylocella silvestris (strain DSM 15510 / CIP 108128 / LMG 27833 / NCIMB 13906 / BL2) TaxID=395965 RepID=B8ERA7_METSB|nr:RsmB/NOP family class I SAM-dependent RNA methyltransferase [Methylocella silvestris]ACK50291.1 Fmu (Sun) domain protein [Methylocella silvestris BL2]
MIPGARVAAAIEILDDIETLRRPASDALKDWGLGHRFAGSKDRSAIASLVFDALRKRASSAFLMDDGASRGIMLGALRLARGLSDETIEALFTGEGHTPAQLTSAERDRLKTGDLEGAPAHVAGDFPDWLEPALAAAFGDRLIAETAALAERAPLDLRVNTLKGERDKALARLARLHAAPTRFSPVGLRLPLTPDGRNPSLAGEPDYIRGRVEIQDEGSQLAALLCAASPGEQALDLCAGGGGKALALAAMMQNKGQIYASDDEGRRLAPIYARLARAGARNVQVRPPRKGEDFLADLEGRCDLVLIDAPCTGIGAWRRNPDAKWRIRPGALELRMAEQDQLLAEASRFLKPQGRIVYVTCSLLLDENEERVAAFLAGHAEFRPVPAQAMAERAGLPELSGFASTRGPGLRLSPASSGTDGFYVAMLERG